MQEIGKWGVSKTLYSSPSSLKVGHIHDPQVSDAQTPFLFRFKVDVPSNKIIVFNILQSASPEKFFS